MRFAIATTAVALAVGAVTAGAQCPNGSPPPCASRPAAPLANSVGVLYFESRDTADAFLAEGLAEEIATSLSRVSRLAVKLPGAVRRVQRASAGDVRAIGRALSIRWVVDGSVRRAGQQLRVSVRLVEADKETVAWSNAFTRPIADVLSIQEDIAREVATGVVGALNPVERATVSVRPTTSAEAYERYLKANWYMGRRGQWLLRARDEFAAALRADPKFVAARAGLALAMLSMADYAIVVGDAADNLRDQALAMADSAIQQDPSSALAWITRGAVLRRHNRLDEAALSVRRGLALDSSSAEGYHRLAQIHFAEADFPSMRAALQRSLAIDASRPITWQAMGTLAYFERRFAEALRMLDTAIAMDPEYQLAFAWKAVVLRIMGDSAGAERAARLRARFAASTGIPVRDSSYASVGMVGHTTVQGLATAGRHQQALDSLVARPPTPMVCRWEVNDPAFDSVRSDARFLRFKTDCEALSRR